MTTIREFARLEETAVQNKDAVNLGERPTRSELLGEAAVADSFSTFFSPTWATEKHTLVDQDLRAPDLDIWLTPLVTDEPPRMRTTIALRRVMAERSSDPFQRANSDRVALLARKYVSKVDFVDEDSARLAILTERVRRLLPAVTAADLEALESALTASQQVSESDIALRKLLGLPLRGA